MDTKAKPRKTHQMTLRLRYDLIERIDRINRIKYHNTRSRTSLMAEALWTFVECNELGDRS